LLVLLLALVRAGPAAAEGPFGVDRESWLKTYYGNNPQDKTAVIMWGVGASDVLTMVAVTNGCTGADGVSGAALTSATADLLRQKPHLSPIVAAIMAYGKLSGCTDAVERGLHFGAR
jgi:hypothetical protein